jgi:hypothetical protein
MIPNEIKRIHVLSALREIDRTGVPPGRAPTKFWLLNGGKKYPPKYAISVAARIATGQALEPESFSGGSESNRFLEKLGFEVAEIAPHDLNPRSALALELYGRFSRHDVYATEGIRFDQRNYALIQGLSPRCKDDGYFIFITLNKDEMEPSHNYDDQLFANQLVWVTRRDRAEDHPDYVRLREPDCRVSLFVRTHSAEDFAYLGELTCQSNKQFIDEASGKVQQRYVWSLNNPLPEAILSELTFGLQRPPKRRPALKELQRRGRAPTSFDELKKAYCYAIDSTERTVVPAHQNYQVRLQTFLASKGIAADMERDFVDVAFRLADQDCIGEIKVTTHLTAQQAFRTAIGQVLDYAHALYKTAPVMIAFFDVRIDQQRVQLASKLGIAVVTEKNCDFVLENPQVMPKELAAVFTPGERVDSAGGVADVASFSRIRQKGDFA